ncbi:unnamed protein product [Dicrocoelium dendriticum]|nr:unnamed protein product [Dicrocoelium dendriticum]
MLHMVSVVSVCILVLANCRNEHITTPANLSGHVQMLDSHVTGVQIRRFALRAPINTGILFVPEREAWIVERLGKFHRTLDPGLNFCIPLVDRIAYVQSLKEVAIEIPDQSAITSGIL